MQKVKSLLCMESDESRIIGIWGMGGVGKTTVARAVFDNLNYQFEGKCFVANVREVSARHGIQSLQEEILSTILMEKGLKIANEFRGSHMMSRLCLKRVLLVINNVDDEKEDKWRKALEDAASVSGCHVTANGCLIMTTDLDARGRWIWNARESAGFGLARRRRIWTFVVRLEGRSEVEADPKSRFEFVVQDKSRQFVVWMCLWALDMDAHRGA
ncbi:hypothetical protein LguiB_010351 [Lonicera macranthoides]